jgi:hypothetical protein
MNGNWSSLAMVRTNETSTETYQPNKDLRSKVLGLLTQEEDAEALVGVSREELATEVASIVEEMINRMGVTLDPSQQVDMATGLVGDVLSARRGERANVLKHETGLTREEAVEQARNVTKRKVAFQRAA